MRSLEQEFNEYIEGSNELYRWKCGLKRDFENGKKINKTKYQKICNLYEERRSKARNLLEYINSRNTRVKMCMPAHYPPPPLPLRQPKC